MVRLSLTAALAGLLCFVAVPAHAAGTVGVEAAFDTPTTTLLTTTGTDSVVNIEANIVNLTFPPAGGAATGFIELSATETFTLDGGVACDVRHELFVDLVGTYDGVRDLQGTTDGQYNDSPASSSSLARTIGYALAGSLLGALVSLVVGRLTRRRPKVAPTTVERRSVAVALVVFAAPAAAAETVEVTAALTPDATEFMGDVMGTWDLFCVVGEGEPCQEDVAGTAVETNELLLSFPAAGGEGSGTFTGTYDPSSGAVAGTLASHTRYELVSGCDGVLDHTDADSTGPFTARIDGTTFTDTGENGGLGPIFVGTAGRSGEAATTAEAESVGDGTNELAAALVGAVLGGAVAAGVSRVLRRDGAAAPPSPPRLFSDDESLHLLEENGLVERVVGPDGIASASIVVQGDPTPTAPEPGAAEPVSEPTYEGPSAADRFAAEAIETAMRVVTNTPPPEPPAPPVEGSLGDDLARDVLRTEMLHHAEPGDIPTTSAPIPQPEPKPAPPPGDPYARTRPHFAQAADVLLRGMDVSSEEKIALARAIEDGAKKFVHEPNFHFEDTGLTGDQQGAPNEAVDALRRAAAEMFKGLDVPEDVREEVVNAMLDEVARHFARDLLS